MDEEMSGFPPALPNRIVHITCPQCDSPKAVVAHTHFREVACFCPACEHVWDCDVSVVFQAND
jgi:hypothetical protein